MDNIVKKECQKDVINLLQEKEYNEDGVRMFFRNFVNIEVEKQLKDEVNKYKEKQKRRIIDVYNAFNEDIPNEIKKIKMLERLPFRTTLKDYERYFKIQCILSKLLYNGFYDFNAYKVIPYYEAISLKDIDFMPVIDVPRRKNNTPVSISANMELLVSKAISQNFVPVIDDSETFIGMVKRRTIVEYCYEKMKK